MRSTRRSTTTGPAHGGCRHESRPAACSACDVWTECSVRAVCVHATPRVPAGRSPAPGHTVGKFVASYDRGCSVRARGAAFVDCPLGCHGARARRAGYTERSQSHPRSVADAVRQPASRFLPVRCVTLRTSRFDSSIESSTKSCIVLHALDLVATRTTNVRFKFINIISYGIISSLCSSLLFTSSDMARLKHHTYRKKNGAGAPSCANAHTNLS